MKGIIGIGVDICKISRFSEILKKDYSDRMISKVLHSNEKKREITAQFLSSRWAAKEALVKATGNRLLIFSQVEINYNEIGQPIFTFHDTTKSLLSTSSFHLSISHEQEYCVAFVIALANNQG